MRSSVDMVQCGRDGGGSGGKAEAVEMDAMKAVAEHAVKADGDAVKAVEEEPGIVDVVVVDTSYVRIALWN